MTEIRLRIGDRDVVLVEGAAGWGECSPLPGYPCDPGRARAAAHEAAAMGWPELRRDCVEVSALLDDPDATTPCDAPVVKLKVGRTDPDRELAWIARVRAAVGAGVRLRLDANGAWDVDTAVDVLRRVPTDIEFVEQPVSSIDDLARVRERVDVPIAADECVRSVADARRVRTMGAADVLVLKVQPLGGVRAALAVAAEADLPTVVTSMFETSIGIAAGLALACALPEPPLACGLATLDRLAGDVVCDPLLPHAGVLAVPARFPPVPDPVLIDRYRVAA